MGGHSQPREPSDEERDMFIAQKAAVEAQTGEQYPNTFVPIACTSQVVAGTNFWVKFQTDSGFVHVKIFRPLPHTGNPPNVV